MHEQHDCLGLGASRLQVLTLAQNVIAAAAVICLASAGWEWSAPQTDVDAAFGAQFTSAALQP